ncbi:IucA/IucC family protein [Halomarina halobia]|uniref:IucA/IucC family protein n=1 Tax=Halomarina halobia TaxID=3033386 RepID=A0ABD6A5N8_9EURY|nr:IucA/IucC family siderophore biosynthesis protein [Halomarina sp. PSR21]
MSDAHAPETESDAQIPETDDPLPEPLADALDADVWETVGTNLLEKMLAEFAYEGLIDPTVVGRAGEVEGESGDDARDGIDTYRLTLDRASYRFRAERRLFDGYRVLPGSVERYDGESWEPATDPIRFVRDAREHVGMDGMTAGHLVREYNHTLLADAHIEARRREREGNLLDLSYAELEGEMGGHPWITYNKGRIGWSYDDYRRYAPERKRRVRLSWLAVRRSEATFAAVSDLDYGTLVREELGDAHDELIRTLERAGRDPEDYYLLPVHDWQWENSVVQLFPAQIAAGDVVPLGEGPDEYLPMQSIRTFVNVSDPEKRNVKLPMRILNTLVYRGLPGERTEAAPLVTEYVKRVRDGDPFLREECELILPGEVAGLNYDHPDFAAIEGSPYQYDELLGCVWRESVESLVRDDERPVTLAALLHVDADGTPFVSKLVERSGLSLEEWLDELFGVVLPPLLHYLYRYGTAFSPHGENAILVLDEECVPTRLAVKDFVDDVNVSEHPLPELADLPPELDAVLRTEPPEGLCQFVVAGLFVGVFRYLSSILTEHHGYEDAQFWTQVRGAVEDYQARFPELEERFALFDLLRPEFTKLCLNRNRMLDYGYADADGRPHASEHGTVGNALYEVARED